jgi:hypothetical protein
MFRLRHTGALSCADNPWGLRTNPLSCIVGTQIENFAFTVSRSPQPELSARNRQGHFVEMPLRGRTIASAAVFSSKKRPECQTHPRTVSQERHPPTRGDQILDLAEAECEAWRAG